MKVALVLRRHFNPLGGYWYEMMARILDDPSENGKLNLIEQLVSEAYSVSRENFEIQRVIDLPSHDTLTPRLVEILGEPSSAHRPMIEAWLTEIVGTAFSHGDVMGHNEALIERS